MNATPTPTSSTRRAAPKKRGQGMTEYIIIVALIAIGTIGVVTLFGDHVRMLFSASADALAGDTSVQVDTKSKRGRPLQKKTLADFGEKNSYGE